MDNIIGKKAAKAFEKMEKCYGIVKAGMNDCATAKASCAGSATKDKRPMPFYSCPKDFAQKSWVVI